MCPFVYSQNCDILIIHDRRRKCKRIEEKSRKIYIPFELLGDFSCIKCLFQTIFTCSAGFSSAMPVAGILFLRHRAYFSAVLHENVEGLARAFIEDCRDRRGVGVGAGELLAVRLGLVCVCRDLDALAVLKEDLQCLILNHYPL